MVTRNKTTIVFFGENEILMNHEAFGISSTFHKPLKAYSFELPIKILEFKKKKAQTITQITQRRLK